MLARYMLAAAVSLSLVAPALALEVIYPADKTSVERSDYLIIKTGDEAIGQVTVAINGVKSDLIDISSPAYRKSFKDVLILRPDFDAGLNTVEVEGISGSKVVARAEAKIHYRSGLLDRPPAGFVPFVMHIAEREALCSGCHNMNPTQEQMNLPNAKQNPCGSCHRRGIAKKHVHGPAGVWECGSCHDASSRPQKYQSLKTNIGQLCNECHDDKIEEFKRKPFVHGPVETGACTVCHDAHASDNLAQLHDTVNSLCLSCHQEITTAHIVRGITVAYHPLEGPVNPANPLRPFDCSSCHDPHSGNSEKYFQQGATSRFNLCSNCHKK